MKTCNREHILCFGFSCISWNMKARPRARLDHSIIRTIPKSFGKHLWLCPNILFELQILAHLLHHDYDNSNFFMAAASQNCQGIALHHTHKFYTILEAIQKSLIRIKIRVTLVCLSQTIIIFAEVYAIN